MAEHTADIELMGEVERPQSRSWPKPLQRLGVWRTTLADRLRSLSVPTVIALIGGFLAISGVVAILLGWYGAARVLPFEQVPYLISGGLLGVALAITGGLVYLGSWVSRLAQQQREDARELRALLEGLRGEGAVLGSATSVASAPDEGARRTVVLTGGFVATPTGTMFHRPSCQVVSGRDDLREASGDEAGLHPCKLCDPLAA